MLVGFCLCVFRAAGTTEQHDTHEWVGFGSQRQMLWTIALTTALGRAGPNSAETRTLGGFCERNQSVSFQQGQHNDPICCLLAVAELGRMANLLERTRSNAGGILIIIGTAEDLFRHYMLKVRKCSRSRIGRPKSMETAAEANGQSRAIKRHFRLHRVRRKLGLH